MNANAEPTLQIGSRWIETDSGVVGIYQGEDPDDSSKIILDFSAFIDGWEPSRLPKEVFLARWRLQGESGCYQCARDAGRLTKDAQ